MVRQFRPAVFCKSEAAKTVPWNPDTPPVNEYSTEPGKTWELCAGIIGRVRSLFFTAAGDFPVKSGIYLKISLF